MSETKIVASFALPGRVLRTEKSISKKDMTAEEKEVFNNTHTFESFTTKNGKGKVPSLHTIALRKAKDCSQNLHLTKEAYSYFVSNDGIVPGMSHRDWAQLSKNKKVKAHLLEIAKNLGGKLDSFTILDD